MDNLMKLTEGIDVDAYSISRSTHLSSTVVGLGTVSGRAIMAVGVLALRGIETVTIRRRLRTISSQLHEGGTISDQVFRDLLELQRIGLYSLNVRRKAWSLIFFALDQPIYTTQITETIMEWPSVEIQLFVRQLAIFKLKGWSSSTAGLPGLSDEALDAGSPQVSLAFQSIVYAVLQKDAQIIHEIFDIGDFALLLTSTTTTTAHPSENALSLFIKHWAESFYPKTMLSGMKLFLDTSSTDRRLQLVEDTLGVFRHLAGNDNTHPAWSISTMDESGHAMIPILRFIIWLCDADGVFATAFTDGGVVGLIGTLHSAGLRASRTEHSLQSVLHPVEVLCCQIVIQLCWHAPQVAADLQAVYVDLFLRVFTYVMDYRQYMVRFSDIQDRFYDCMYELLCARLDAYPQGAVTEAWRVIFSQMSSRTRTKDIVNRLLTPDSGSGRCHSFFRQCVDLIQSERTLDEDQRLEYYLGEIVQAILEIQPSIVASELTVDEVTTALIRRGGRNVDEPLAGFFVFLDETIHKNHPMNLTHLPKIGLALIQYLKSAAQAREDVLRYIINTIRPVHGPSNPSSMLHPMHQSTRAENSAYPIYALLLFTLHLVDQSEDCAHVLLDLDLVYHLAELCNHWFTEAIWIDTQRTYGGYCRMAAFCIIGAICRHRDLWVQVFSSRSIECFVHLGSLGTSLPVLSGSVDYQRLVVSHIQYMASLNKGAAAIEDGDLQVLLRHVHSRQSKQHARPDLAMGILICYASLPEDHWSSMAGRMLKIITHQDLLALSSAICQYIICLQALRQGRNEA